MTNRKLLAFTLLMTVPLASCSFLKKKNPVLTADIDNFLTSRGVADVEVPVIAAVADKDVVDSGAISFDDIPCFEYVVTKNLTSSYKSKLTKAKWTISEIDYGSASGIEAVDPNSKVAVQYAYLDKTTAASFNLDVGTYTHVYAYADLHGEDPGPGPGPGPSTGIASDVAEFLSGRGVSGVDFSFLNSIDTDTITYTGTEDGSSGYCPCIYYYIEGNAESSLLSMFRSAGWTVPSTATEYGYECIDPSGTKVEADVLYDSDSSETSLSFYAIADLNGGGEGGEGGEGGGEGIENLQQDLATFMKARGIDSVTIPFISSVSASDILAGEYSTEPVTEDGETYPPYFYFQVSGDKVNTYLSSLSGASWSVPSQEGDYGYECVDPSGKCEVDIAYIDEETAELYALFGLEISAGTTVYVYSVADLDGSGEGGEGGEGGGGTIEGDTLADQVTSYMSGRGVSGVSFTFLNNIDESLIESATAYAAQDDYAPYFEVVLTGDVESSVLSIFRNANWTVPSTAGDYGYECMDPSGSKAEADVVYYENYTYIDFYAYDDIYGEGGEGGGSSGGGGTLPETDGDALIAASTGVSGTTYTDWTYTGESGAVYSGNTAAGAEGDVIQLRNKPDKGYSGIVTTTSGGTIASVEVAFNSETVEGRTLNIYVSNSPFSSPEDLYGDGLTLAGTIVCGTSTSFTISGSYAYVGVLSAQGAIYLDYIVFNWN